MINQVKPFSDKICYYINFGSLGDCLAAAPVVKYAIEKFHSRDDNYKVAIHEKFRPTFHFVAEDKIIYLKNLWDGNPENYSELNDYKIKALADIIYPAKPKHLHYHDCTKCHIVDQASWQLLSRIIDLKELPYVPLEYVPVSDFGVPFHHAVVICVTYIDKIRSWKNAEILKTAQNVKEMGLVPVFVGKTDTGSDFEYPGFGINLVDKTSIQELATIMDKSRAILCMDSGLMHLAFSTNTTVIAGFTMVRPELRIPHRPYASTIAITPNEVPCRFCYSDWNLVGRSGCPKGSSEPECVDAMTAEKFTDALKKVIG